MTDTADPNAPVEHTAAEGSHYCPGCGQRYDTPGTCTGTAESGHEPITVEKVKTTGKAKDDGGDK